jgi:hypothetical protein
MANQDKTPKDNTQGKSLDLEKWERKALKALKEGKPASVTFNSDEIPEGEQARIRAALELCKTAEDVKAAFIPPVIDLAMLYLEWKRSNDLLEAAI